MLIIQDLKVPSSCRSQRNGYTREQHPHVSDDARIYHVECHIVSLYILLYPDISSRPTEPEPVTGTHQYCLMYLLPDWYRISLRWPVRI